MSHTLLRDLHQAAANLEAAVVTQHVWGVRPGHRDELILRDRATGAGTSSGSDEPLDERLWCLMDYYDPTAIVDNEGAVVERYRFSAFGLRAILDADFDPRAESDYAWDFAFKGQFLDLESGYYNYGYRYYSPELGRWLSRDPIGERGGVNLYAMAGNDTVNQFDYLGRQAIPTTVSNLDQAIAYYRGKYGGTVQATDSVDSEIKGSSSYKEMINELKSMLAKELESVSCSNTSGVVNRDGGTRGVKTGTKTVGSVTLEIAPYEINWIGWRKDTRDKHRTVSGLALLTFTYTDQFKFEWDKDRPVVTFFSDVIPGVIAGSGTDFTIKGGFSDAIEIETSQCCNY